jgi:hypothetical protein
MDLPGKLSFIYSIFRYYASTLNGKLIQSIDRFLKLSRQVSTIKGTFIIIYKVYILIYNPDASG